MEYTSAPRRSSGPTAHPPDFLLSGPHPRPHPNQTQATLRPIILLYHQHLSPVLPSCVLPRHPPAAAWRSMASGSPSALMERMAALRTSGGSRVASDMRPPGRGVRVELGQ